MLLQENPARIPTTNFSRDVRRLCTNNSVITLTPFMEGELHTQGAHISLGIFDKTWISTRKMRLTKNAVCVTPVSKHHTKI